MALLLCCLSFPARATPVNNPTLPPPLRQALDKAAEMILSDRPKQAITILVPLMKSYPDYTVVLTMAGMAYGKTGDNRKAVRLETRALVLDPKNLSARISLGIAQGNTGHFDQEVLSEREVLRQNPGNETAWEALGWAYGSMGQWKAAKAAEEKAISLNAHDVGARMILGLALAHQGFLQEALIMEKSAEKLAPDDQGVRQSLRYIRNTMAPAPSPKPVAHGFNPLLSPTPGSPESVASPGASQPISPPPIKAPSVLH